MLKEKGVGVMNGGPFSARLLTNSTLPPWFRDPKEVQDAAKKDLALELKRNKQGVIEKDCLCSHAFENLHAGSAAC